MRKTVAALASILIASTGGIAAAGAAQAFVDSPRCVTRAEFNKVHEGMKKTRVHRIFDIHGKFGDGGAGGYTRIYKECHPRGGDGCTTVEYQDGPRRPARVGDKTWNGICG